MNIQVTITCNGEVTSSEAHQFQSPWRAIADTVEGCGYIYHSKQVVKSPDGEYKLVLSDGTVVTAKPLNS